MCVQGRVLRAVSTSTPCSLQHVLVVRARAVLMVVVVVVLDWASKGRGSVEWRWAVNPWTGKTWEAWVRCDQARDDAGGRGRCMYILLDECEDVWW